MKSLIERQRIKSQKACRKYEDSAKLLLSFIINKTDGGEWTEELLCDGFNIKHNKMKRVCTVKDFERFTSLYKGFITKNQFEMLCTLTGKKREDMEFSDSQRRIADVDLFKVIMEGENN